MIDEKATKSNGYMAVQIRKIGIPVIQNLKKN